MPDRLLSVFRHQAFELTLGTFMLEKCRPRGSVQRRKLRPRIRRTHVDDADRLNARAWRLGIDQVGRNTQLDAAPEFLLGRDQYADVEWIHWDRDFRPFAAT